MLRYPQTDVMRIEPSDVAFHRFGNKNARTFRWGYMYYLFSYTTLVKFWDSDSNVTVCRQNDWGTTTGKHMSMWGKNIEKNQRLTLPEFNEALEHFMAPYKELVTMKSSPDMFRNQWDITQEEFTLYIDLDRHTHGSVTVRMGVLQMLWNSAPGGVPAAFAHNGKVLARKGTRTLDYPFYDARRLDSLTYSIEWADTLRNFTFTRQDQ